MSEGVDMKIGDSVKELRKIHKEFTENPYFSVFSVVTQHDDWLCIDKSGVDLAEKKRDARIGKIFNLVVKENSKTVGSINIEDLNNPNWKKNIVDLDDYSISASTSLFDITERMVKDSVNLERKRSPLYFVRDPASQDSEPVGIATFWDLNRAPSYILTYPILVYLEHTIFLAIKESHTVWHDHSELLSRIMSRFRDRYGNISGFFNAPKYDYKELSRWGLPELVTFYRYDVHIRKGKFKISDELIDSFSDGSDFRNRVGHTVKLLVEDKDDTFHTDLRRLYTIWNAGKPAFINFIDPKLRHSSPIMWEET